MKPFRERNQTMIGAIGIVVILVMMVAAFKADKLPIIGAGDIYYANFSEVGGLHAGNEVRVAGVAVGNVDEIELEGDHVKVTFKLDKGTDLGSSTAAEIKVRTLLGATYLGLVPAGSGELADRRAHPQLAHQRAVRRCRGLPGAQHHDRPDRLGAGFEGAQRTGRHRR